MAHAALGAPTGYDEWREIDVGAAGSSHSPICICSIELKSGYQFTGAMMPLRNIIARAALQHGRESVWSSSVMQEFHKGDITVKVRYLHTGAIWHGEWSCEGTRRHVDSENRNHRDVIIAWFEEGGAARHER